MEELMYKSFCWSFGTTSFRTKNFNKTIELQLMLLDEFWKLPGHDEVLWLNNKATQIEYYNFLHKKGFLEGNATRKDKDAREKTSGLVDIGLINEERLLTNVGTRLLEIAKQEEIGIDEFLYIPNDSLIYLKQLLKYGIGLDGKYIRPFVAIIYAICELSYLSFDEFMYLLPLAITKETLFFIIDAIKRIRKNEVSIDDVIIERLMSMQNYQSALEYFIENKTSEEVICSVGLNRKSRNYDIVYYDLYNSLYEKYVHNKSNIDKKIIESIKENSNKNITTRWMNLLYDTFSEKSIINDSIAHTIKTKFDEAKNENKFKKTFFEYMHLIKAKATLYDYFDLNMRYIKTTNCITFRDEKVELDTIPSIVFNNVKNALLDIVDKESKDLCLDVPLGDICKSIEISDKVFIDLANIKFSDKFGSKKDVLMATEIIRYKNLNDLIDKIFTKDKIVELLTWFEKRDDSNIQKYFKCEADIPTLFEYVIGITWYIISEKRGKILDYMQLSLDADLLPRTHASGGGSDIIYEYEATQSYPKHTMLLEATLSEKVGQRVMEMEPVSRHLGDYLIEYNGKNDYCTFITNFLNPNLISDYRGRKNMIYYDRLGSEKSISGMKIMPIETKILKQIIINDYNYEKIYKIFDNAYNVDDEPLKWYRKTIEGIFL